MNNMLGGIEVTQRFENVLVTPEIAKIALSRNYEQNRKIRSSYVRQLASVMKSGRFESQNGQTLVFDADTGVMFDGQHRLSAVVLAGTTHIFGCAYIKDAIHQYKSIDNGTRRLTQDYVHVKNNVIVSSIAKVMACVEWGEAPLLSSIQGKMTPKEQVDRGIVISYYDTHAKELEDAAFIARRTYRSMGQSVPASIIGTFYMIVKYCGDQTLLDEFMNDISSDIPISKTCVAYRNIVLKTRASSRGKPDVKWYLGTLFDAYSHYLALDESTMFNKYPKRLEYYDNLIRRARLVKKTNAGGVNVTD